MPRTRSSSYTGPRGDDIEICTETVDGHYCGQRHVTRFGTQACTGHVVNDRESYVKGQDRRKLDEPRPCLVPASTGAVVCQNHGAKAPRVTAAAEKRTAEQKAARAVLAKLGDAGQPVVDPIGKLCAIAGRAVQFMEALGERVDSLDDATASDQARAEIAVYGRSIKDAAGVVESIIRMGIAERLAKQDADRTNAWVTFIDGVLLELGHNPRDPKVSGVVLRMLERAS